MKVVNAVNFSIYVYPNDHPPPHCHVRYKDGTDISIDLPLVLPRYGATISKEVEELIESNIDKLCEVWEKLNQQKNYDI
ncbi:MAG: hypothetical protein JWQ09_5964 [Segetibacter sp.]|nr:hypothetical protein [Segetibacter sp.]